MALELNGKFWRIDEIASRLGYSYSQVYHMLGNVGGLLKIGTTILVPDPIAQDIFAGNPCRKAEDRDVQTMSISKVASSLNMGQEVVYKLIQLGLPTVVIGKKKRIANDVFEAIEPAVRDAQDQYGCVPMHAVANIWGRIKDKLKSKQ